MYNLGSSEMVFDLESLKKIQMSNPSECFRSLLNPNDSKLLQK